MPSACRCIGPAKSPTRNINTPESLINVFAGKMAVAWKSTLNKALEANKHLKYSTFFQLATVRPDGRPSVRTVVFRGFLDDSTKITFTTDTR